MTSARVPPSPPDCATDKPHPRRVRLHPSLAHWRALAALIATATLGYCVAPYPARATKKTQSCPYRRPAR
ncbi:MAG: hypothetical protein EXR75_06680 [Myxococcales bacterium]|nr:hypothetical protein [Myxococcales bacterium]